MQSTNPFETYPETIQKIYREKHKCPTIWKYDEKYINGSCEANVDTKKCEYWENEECALGYCEYCNGWRWNEYFQEKPTDEEINDLILKQLIKCEMAKKEKRKKRNEIIYGSNKNNGQLITLCIDKEYIQVPKLATEIISVIRSTDYQCISDSKAVIELYGENGWNPHIHIVTKKLKQNGQLAQLFRRKFVKQKYQCYRVDVKDMPYESALAYVMGEKESDKIEMLEKDMEYRKKNNLQDVYDI